MNLQQFRATLASAALAAAFLPSAALATWTASGSFHYTDRLYDTGGFTGTAVEPVRFADVEVFDANTLALLASGATDGAGNFSIFVSDSAPRDVAARALTSTNQTADLFFAVVDDQNAEAIYSYVDAASGTSAGHDGATNVNFGAMTMPLATGDFMVIDFSAQAFNLFDMGVLLADWIENVDGAPPAPFFSMAFSPGSGRTGSFYSGGINRFFCSDDDGYDDSNILHELGHYIEDEFGESDNTGGSHALGDNDQDPRLSWSEGWATFVSNATLDFNARPRPDVYSDRNSFGTTGGFGYSLESASIGGSANERSVNAALYDMIDSAATADNSPGSDDDAMSNQQANVWAVLEEFRVRQPLATQAEDFWDLWFELGFGQQVEMGNTWQIHRLDYYQDVQEPNGSPEGAGVLTPNVAYASYSFYRSGGNHHADNDWFSLAATAGTWYLIEVDGANGQIFGRPDPQLFLFDVAGEQILAYNDDRFDTTPNNSGSNSAQDQIDTVPRILWRAPATQTYHVMLRHASNRLNLTGRYGSYRLRASDVGAPAPSIAGVAAQTMLPGQRYSALIVGSNFATDAVVSTGNLSFPVVETRWLGQDALYAVFAPNAALAPGLYNVTVSNPGASSTQLNNALAVDAAAQPPVMITELEVGTLDRVELKNIGTVPADLTNWELRTQYASPVAPYVFPSGFTLAPGATVVVSDGSGTDTASSLFDQSASINWSWGNLGTQDINLMDTLGAHVDYVRTVRNYVTTHVAPEGSGLWFQPEIQGPDVNFGLSRHVGSGLARTAIGLSQATITMPAADGAGRDNLVDPYEENDSPRQAMIWPRTSTISDLAISPFPGGRTDEDWFGFLIRSGDEFRVDVLFSHAMGDLNAELYAPEEETTPIATASSTTDNETMVLDASTTSASGGGIYRLRVFGAGGATNAAYSIQTSPMVPVSPSGFVIE